MLNFRNLPPLSLYIHLPWCVRKCPYCDFNSHAVKDSIPEAQYLAALIDDLQQALPQIWGRRIHSIFFGGGTPSLFSPKSIDTILSSVRALLQYAPDIEVTLEANPGTAEQANFRGFKEAGVNRLSIGVQSFNDTHLGMLGRIHNSADAINAIHMAKSVGLHNFNIDLMFGLPDQSLQQALDDVRTALALKPTHISYYQLTIEPNTQFAHQPPTLPFDDIILDIQTQSQQILSDAGMSQYEVSAYANAGHQSNHNTNYWQFGDYLGLGAGAHSKISDANQQTITRYSKLKNPRDYMLAVASQTHIEGDRVLTPNDVCFEFMLNALRLNEGFETSLFEERTGLSINDVAPQLKLAQEKQLITWTLKQVQPTPRGRLFLNDLQEIFLQD